MKKELLIGTLAVGYLALSVGANAFTTHQETAKQTAALLEMKMQEVQASNRQFAATQSLIASVRQNTMTQKQIATTQATPSATEGDLIGEGFKITEIKDGYVRGEKTTGTGEGIYYTTNLFGRFGLDNIKVGDKVQVLWTKADYDNENWDNVENIIELNS